MTIALALMIANKRRDVCVGDSGTTVRAALSEDKVQSGGCRGAAHRCMHAVP